MQNSNGLSIDRTALIEIATSCGVTLSEKDIERLGNLADLFSELRAKIMEVSIEIVSLIDENYGYKELISRSMGVPTDLVNRFEKVGRGGLHPQLVYAETPGERALSRLPISDQNQWISTPIPVLLPNGDHMLVLPKDLTPDQRKQVFGKSVRTLAEQKPVMEEIRSGASIGGSAENSIVITIEGKNLVITANGVKRKLTQKEVLAYASQIA